VKAARYAAIVVTLLALFGAPAASAHPYLVASTPEAGVVAPGAVNAIRIAFTEHLVLQGSSVVVRDADGHVVRTGRVGTALGGDGLTASTGHLAEGIYTVNWVALGDDGHTVAGSFRFGVPGGGGQVPPGAGALLASTNSNGSEQAPTESLISIAARWVAAVAAFVLLGGALLLARLRARSLDDEAARRRWLSWARWALALALLGTVVEAVERSRAPTGGGLRLGLLTASTTGVAVIVRLALLAVVAVALRFVPGARRAVVLGGAGALALAALAIDGHVATAGRNPVPDAVAQIVHLLSAGVWVGGVVVLAGCVAPLALAAGRRAEVLAAGRAFSPIAAVAAVLTIATGLIAAVREVGHWYFLRWSSYGHLLLVKGGLVLVVLALGGVTTLLARRAVRGGSSDRVARGLLRTEAVVGVGVVAIAATLAGTLQGRGQPLPAQRGNLLPGAGFADVALNGSLADMTLAPARPGLNRIVVAFASPFGPRGAAPLSPPRRASVALSCACGSRPIGLNVPLRPGGGGRDAWYGDVELPLPGVWIGALKVDGHATIGSPTFTLGLPHAPGSSNVTVASVADLSGPDALDCRSQEIGALMSIELMNVVGGVDGRKITQEVLDDGGDPAVARREALQLAAQHPVAFLDPCGDGASAALAAVGDKIPTIVADPNVPITQGSRVFRFAPNPYDEGYAAGQYVGRLGLSSVPKSTPRRIAALMSPTADSRERLLGLEQALSRYGVRVQTFPSGGPGLVPLLRALMPASKWLGIYLDGQFGPLASALRTVGPEIQGHVNPTAILTSSRLASERFIEASGELGREGQIRSLTDVDPTSTGAQTYAMLAPQIVGELPTLPGLSGFVSGQALAYGLTAGTSASAITSRLREPRVFSQAAISPWSDRDSAAGTVMFRVFLPSFLTENLIPSGGGLPGEVSDGQFFPDGDWEDGASSVFTPLKLGAR
jgi:putative copper export protein/methionine-rich copper-binding protein CopC